MNAKIKLSLFALASAAMLASCGAKGESLTREQAQTELNSYSGMAATPTKVTYEDKTVGENPSKDTKKGTTKSSAILDTTNVYGYRYFAEDTGNFQAGSKYYAYAKDGKYWMGAIIGSSKTYFEANEAIVKAALTASLTALNTYAASQATGTANWIKGLDKAETWMNSNSKDKDNTATYGEGYAGGSVKGYAKADSYTKYADGEMTADITAIYPFQADMVSMGGEHCIYEWKNYQLTRLFNNYQDYEETLDWENASTSDMPIDTDNWTKDDTLAARVALALVTFAHAWSD
ncbi:MAG TPA: hypothetical protein DD384_01975 [Firmicutes bacterium]|nr:hypothetical protein [Bacillota bacterium]